MLFRSLVGGIGGLANRAAPEPRPGSFPPSPPRLREKGEAALLWAPPPARPPLSAGQGGQPGLRLSGLSFPSQHWPVSLPISHSFLLTFVPFFKKKNLFIYLFYFCLCWVCCCAWAFSSCGERGLLFVAVRGLLIAVTCCRVQALGARASVVVARGLSSCGTRA